MPLFDLSQPIFAGMARVPSLPAVEFDPVHRIEHGHPLNTSVLRLATHAGTHVDAPWHFVQRGRTIDQIPLEDLCGEGVVVSVSRGAGEAIEPRHLAEADIRAGDIVLLHTGWSEKFTSDEYYDHPYLSDACARWLVERRVKMVGMDALTPDMPIPRRPKDFSAPVHHILLGADVLIIENLANLAAVAGRRVRVYAFPLRIRGSDAGQARVVAEA